MKGIFINEETLGKMIAFLESTSYAEKENVLSFLKYLQLGYYAPITEQQHRSLEAFAADCDKHGSD